MPNGGEPSRRKTLSLNRTLGFIISGITTLALIGSVILLVRTLPAHRESPLQLLRSGGLLWLTNVIVFALWYWRLDGGGPTLRHKQKKFGSTSFLFPQMQIPRDERAEFACARWRPLFIDYVFVAFTKVLPSARPTRVCVAHPALRAKSL